MQARVKNLVNGAMFAALIALATLVLKLPLPMEKGYCNLGDALILLSGILPPSWAAAAAAVGSVLSDLLLGYAAYAPATAVIKGLMGFAAGKWISTKRTIRQKLVCMVAVEIGMMAGYFLFECAAFSPAAAWAGLIGNGFQAGVCVLAALLMQKPMAMLEKMMKTR